jgi:hypothetical protein
MNNDDAAPQGQGQGGRHGLPQEEDNKGMTSMGADNEETMRMEQVMRDTEKGPGDVDNISWAVGKSLFHFLATN